jgi:hypothetical protein
MMDGQTHQLIRVELGNLNQFLQVNRVVSTKQKNIVAKDVVGLLLGEIVSTKENTPS